MRITVLGSAAGGGFPQWNCHCRLCAGTRDGTLRARPRTQSSAFVQADGAIDGVLLDASPDIGEQLRRQTALQPGRAPRDSAIAAVLLTDAQVDHATGLLGLRERGEPLPVWCTPPVAADLSEGLPVLRLLAAYAGVRHQVVPLDREFTMPGVEGLRFRALAVPGRAPPFSPRRRSPTPGDVIGVTIIDVARGTRAFYAPGLGEVTPAVFDAMGAADAVFVDGTFWTDDELDAVGPGRPRAREIGHLPLSGPGGMLEVLRRLPARTRRHLVHVNNTNPVLDEDSAERAAVVAQGVVVCEDGMVIEV